MIQSIKANIVEHTICSVVFVYNTDIFVRPTLITQTHRQAKVSFRIIFKLSIEAKPADTNQKFSFPISELCIQCGSANRIAHHKTNSQSQRRIDNLRQPAGRYEILYFYSTDTLTTLLFIINYFVLIVQMPNCIR